LLSIDAQAHMGLADDEVFAEGYFDYGSVRLWFSKGYLVREEKKKTGPAYKTESRNFTASAVTDGVKRFVRSRTKPSLVKFLEKRFQWDVPLTPGSQVKV
jgi:hypothetical protein